MQKILEKKWLLFFLVGSLVILFVFPREFFWQLLKLVFAIICIGFLIYKTTAYFFSIGSFLIRFVLSIFAFVLAIGGLGFVLDFLSKIF